MRTIYKKSIILIAITTMIVLSGCMNSENDPEEENVPIEQQDEQSITIEEEVLKDTELILNLNYNP